MDTEKPCRIAQQIDNYKDLIPEQDCGLFCECNLVSKKEIKAKLTSLEAFDDLLKELKVGSGCGSCLKDIEINQLYKKLKE